MPRMTRAATTIMGMTTAMAVLPAGDKPWLVDACFVGLVEPPVELDVGSEVCWPLFETFEDVTRTVVGGNEVS